MIAFFLSVKEVLLLLFNSSGESSGANCAREPRVNIVASNMVECMLRIVALQPGRMREMKAILLMIYTMILRETNSHKFFNGV